MKIELQSVAFWALAGGLVAVAALNSWLSRINQFFFFSRTVEPAFAESSRARQISSGYLRGVWLGCVASVLAYAGIVASTRLSLVASFALAVLLECVLCSAAFARAHRLTGDALAESPAPSAGDRDHADAPAAVVSVPLLDPTSFTRAMLVQLVLAPVCAFLAWVVPMWTMHMDLGSFATAISDNGAAFLSGLGLGLMVGSILLYLQLRYFSRHRSPMARFTARGCVILAWCGAAAMALSSLSVPLHLVITPAMKGTILVVILAVAFLRLAYSWTRLHLFAPPQIERSGDQFWRWGLFYYNPSDPTLFIQHRAGPGFTMNFANFFSWPLALFLAADLVFLVSFHLYR